MDIHLEEIAHHVAPGARPRPAARSGWVAWLGSTDRARKYHPDALAAPLSRIEPRREYMAVYARQLVVQSHLQILR